MMKFIISIFNGTYYIYIHVSIFGSISSKKMIYCQNLFLIKIGNNLIKVTRFRNFYKSVITRLAQKVIKFSESFRRCVSKRLTIRRTSAYIFSSQTQAWCKGILPEKNIFTHIRCDGCKKQVSGFAVFGSTRSISRIFCTVLAGSSCVEKETGRDAQYSHYI